MTDFHTQALKTLDFLMENIDTALGDQLDVEMENGILTIEHEKTGQYIINQHGPSQQIWVSSPISGAWHFAQAGDQWQSTRSADTLFDLLSHELQTITNQPDFKLSA